MFQTLRVRFHQGNQFIPNIRKAAAPDRHRGMPSLDASKCTSCAECVSCCPTKAIEQPAFTLDLGKCIFCGDCERICSAGAIAFTPFHKLAASTREGLTISPETTQENYQTYAMQSRKKIRSMFGRSLKLRQVSVGGCNGCEMELNASTNVNFDMGRFGFEFVASPRHADGIVISGPISENMAASLEDTYNAVPDPKIIILTGSCAISGGIYADSESLKRDFLSRHPADLYVPGCPVHPLTFINGILDYLTGSPKKR